MNFTILVISIVVVMLLIMTAVVMASRARDMAMDSSSNPIDDELAEFKRMREEGRISEEEYRRLRDVVAAKTVSDSKQPKL